MKKNVEVEVCLHPDELASELWDMSDKEQADFLCELARIHRFKKNDFLMQLQFLSDEINNEEDAYGKEAIVKSLETILEYLKGDV
jgi:hypothetical protein